MVRNTLGAFAGAAALALSLATVPHAAASWKLKPVTSTAVTEKERLQDIGSYLKRMGDADIFSGAIVIARDGKPVFAQAYGFIAGPYLGRPFVGHNGRAPGQCTEFGELRDTPYTIAVLSNVENVCRAVTQRILRVLATSSHASSQRTPGDH
jgi:hypothetical protein